MDELWGEFWNSFSRICQLEFQHISFIKLIALSVIGTGLVHVGCLIYVRVKGRSIYPITEILIILIFSYVVFITQITLFSRGVVGGSRNFDTKWLWIDGSMDQNVTNLLNIILFIPFGFFVAGIQRNKKSMRRLFMVINYSFLFSLFIEATQYLTNRGFFEIDDIEANILGGLIGSIFYNQCCKIVKLIFKKNMEGEK